jgi:integrase/recombinase XerD
MRQLTKDLSDFFAIKQYADGTLASYQNRMREFVSYLSQRLNKPADEIDLNRILTIKDARGEIITVRPINAEILDSYFQELYVQTNSYSKLVHTRYVLVSFFKYLERNYQFKSPMRDLKFNFKILKPHSKARTALTRHEILKVLNAVVTHSQNLRQDVVLYALLFSAGRRISELLNLKVKHFDFNRNTFLVEKTKSGRQFVSPMIKDMGKAIHLYCSQCQLIPDNYLFHRKDGKPLTKDQVRKSFQKYCRLAGIEKRLVHETRRTFATILYSEQVDISIIQQLLDHVKPDTTRAYIEPSYVRNQGLSLKFNQNFYAKIKGIHKMI